MLTKQQLDRLREDIVFEAELRGRRFVFRSTWGLFSPRDIDEGTRLLLKYVEVSPDDDCLDLGCGYGPIGLTLAALAPGGQTLMVDKDFVAVDYSRRNADINGIGNARARLSDGLRHIEEGLRFDLIASNIPAKVGREALSLYLVTINGLRQFMKRNLSEVFGNYDKLKQGAHYTVALSYKC